MADIEKRTFALSEAQAAFIDAQVASGAFESADEVVREGLERLRDHQEAIERWLLEEVVPTYDEMEAHPERAVSGEDWLEKIRERHAAYGKAAE